MTKQSKFFTIRHKCLGVYVYPNKQTEAAVHPWGIYGLSLESGYISGVCEKVYGGGSPPTRVPTGNAVSLVCLGGWVVVTDHSRARLPLLVLDFLTDYGVAVDWKTWIFGRHFLRWLR
jgi:hypothetical protein